MSIPTRISHANEQADPIDIFMFFWLPFLCIACPAAVVFLQFIGSLFVGVKP